MNADNVCFDGTERTTLVTANGQLLIGAATAPYLRPATLTAGAGMVVTNGAGSITLSTGLSQYTDTSGTVPLTANTSYFATAASTFTLPASPSQGDKIRVICDTTGSVVITGNTGQTIRMGVNISAAAGTATNSSRGDSATFVFRSTGSVWIAEDFVGNWTI